MSEVAQALPFGKDKIKSIPCNHAWIKGKVMGVRSITGSTGRRYIHWIRTPAPDEFSSPQNIEVSSDQRLGEKDDLFEAVVSVGGSIRQFTFTNKETGERQTGFEFNARLTVI